MSVHHTLTVYVSVLDPSVYFISIRWLSVANAEAITSELLGMIKDRIRLGHVGCWDLCDVQM